MRCSLQTIGVLRSPWSCHDDTWRHVVARASHVIFLLFFESKLRVSPTVPLVTREALIMFLCRPFRTRVRKIRAPKSLTYGRPESDARLQPICPTKSLISFNALACGLMHTQSRRGRTLVYGGPMSNFL